MGPAGSSIQFAPIVRGIENRVQASVMQSAGKYIDHAVFYEYSYWEVCDAVSAVPLGQLWNRNRLIKELTQKLSLTSPTIDWFRSEISFENVDHHRWAITLIAHRADPNCILSFIKAPRHSDELIEYEDDWQGEQLILKLTICANSVQSTKRALDNWLHFYRLNVDQACRDVERYNAALPYLISVELGKRSEQVQQHANQQDER